MASFTPSIVRSVSRHGVLIALVALILFGYLRYENFLGAFNILSVLRYNAMFALVALGMAYVIMTGGIDLSVGSTAALGSVVAALLSPYGALPGLLGGVAFLGLAALIWQRSRPVVVVQSSRWWKLLLGGVALLATLIVVTTITGELPSGGWYIAMATMFTSFGLIGAGVVLGIAGRMRSVPEA